jgi:hypothetical protein
MTMHEIAESEVSAQPPTDAAVVVENPTVRFADGTWARFTRATVLPGGALAAELTRDALAAELTRDALAGIAGAGTAPVTDTVIYGPSTWTTVYTAPRGTLTAWTWRRDDAYVIHEERQVVATDITEHECRGHAAAWLRRYAVAESALNDLADLAFSQRVTVSDPETIALKFYFTVPPPTRR